MEILRFIGQVILFSVGIGVSGNNKSGRIFTAVVTVLVVTLTVVAVTRATTVV